MQYLVLIMYVHHTRNKGFHVCKKDFIICLLVHQVWQLQGGYQKPGAVYTTRKTRIKKYYLKAVYDSYKKQPYIVVQHAEINKYINLFVLANDV